ncbi:hypothetical protein METBIDRAFT_32758 [Metschnikowia bicuspidata var. bicuspidata NRRL YB-4993]|uniref:Uncharacterized protein n=1 Tax=Metschnikowia bicuspidata var. bicuspidata NRRL YB-4993 TaxID=869754 RepID=A0A1A0H9X2_9ASCO|nr:hypothetical protein METBIDRAFT_32758 [Metschnikowia bicuspidata var. bicuspidata NRRL YB-4993]OBA20800.1 hypothetical protein METBIDRAFT_32758 [Metschnikowia bicuspidata var. bicuspidata NRRL YB-4993]
MLLRGLLPILSGLARAALGPAALGSQPWDCLALTARHLVHDNVVFICVDPPGLNALAPNPRTVVVHAQTLKLLHSKLGFDPDQQWIELAPGSSVPVGRTTKPVSLCLLALHGDGAIQQHLQTGQFHVAATAGMTLGTFGTLWFFTSFETTSEMQATGEQQMEFACHAPAGQRVQIFSVATRYLLLGWRWRPVTISEDGGVVEYGAWRTVPPFTIVDDVPQMACVTDPALLVCDDF